MDSYKFEKIAGDKNAPLLFVFHGTGGDEHQLLDLGKAVAPGATIVSPRGDVSEYGASRFFKRTGEGVYDMDDLARATQKMVAFVREQSAGHRRVFGLGYSNGANILASVIFAAPDLFERAVLMHPLIPFEPEVHGTLAGKRILITAGRRDPICPPNMTSRLEAYLKADGADVTLLWHEGGHELREPEIDSARALFAEGGAAKADDGIKLREDDSKGRYSLRAEDGSEAEMTFSKAGADTIIIDHTLVPRAFRGQGIGLKLVQRGVDDARAAGRKIIPLCPFVAAEFRRHPEWADVLKG